VIDRSSFFHRALPPEPEPERTNGDITVCSHGWGTYVESSDPRELDSWRPAGVRQRAESNCDQGLTSHFAFWAARFAVSKLPYCSDLSDRNSGSPRLLATCAGFSGDRVAAADLYRHHAAAPQNVREDPAVFFRDDAQFEWEGNRVERDAAQVWRSRISGAAGSSYYQRTAHGETSERIRTTGVLERRQDESGGEPSLWRAPVQMTWEHAHGSFQVTRAVIGKFERVVGRCPSGLLTGAEQASNCHR
jgi:hypothetical protein